MYDGGIITRKDIFADEALEVGKEYAKNLEQAISANQKFIESIKEINKLADSMKSAKTWSDYRIEKEKEIKVINQSNNVWKEQDLLEKQLIRTIRQKELATESTNRALIEHRLELQETNKQIKQEILERTGQIGAYKKLENALNNVRNQAKNVKADMFNLEQQGKKNTKEYRNLEIRSKALSLQTNILDKGIKDIDKSLGQHQREVGNYAIAANALNPIFGRVNNQLSMMGISLDEIANKPNPFKALTSGIIAFGKATVAFMLTPVGAVLTILGALFALIYSNKQTVIDFNSGLLNVSKTTGIANEELTSLGNNIIKLSRDLKTVGTPALMEYATVAGQLGVKGSENILKFTRALAMLETASNISGEEGASQIARLLTLVDGGVQNVQDFGDEIVNLGNNFAATESEILANATAIAQNTGVYKIGRQDVLAYATATKAVGVEAELTGSSIGRTLGEMEKAIRTGDNINTIARLTGQSIEDLKKSFREDSSKVLYSFVEGLNAVDKAGGSVNAQLEKIGINSIRDQRVIGSLATGGFETLASAMDTVTNASGAMTKEFETAQSKLENQFNRVGIAWDNVVLSIENGEGIFAQLALFFSGQLAGTLEYVNVIIDELSLSWKIFSQYLDDLFPKTEKTEKSFLSLLKALFSFEKMGNIMRLFIRQLTYYFTVEIPNSVVIAKAGFDVFKNSIQGIVDLVEAVAPEVKKYLKDMLNPFADSDPSSIIDAANKSIQKTLNTNKKIRFEANEEILDNQRKFNERMKKAQEDIVAGRDEALRKRNERNIDLSVDDNNDDDKRKKYLSKLKKLADEEFALNEFRLKRQIEINNLIIENDKESLENKINSLSENIQLEEDILRQSAEKKLKDISWYNDEVRTLTQEEINTIINGGNIKRDLNNQELLVIEEYNAKKTVQEQKYIKSKQDLIDAEVALSKKRTDDILKEQETALNKELEIRTKAYQADMSFAETESERKAITEQYEADIFQIKVDYAKRALNEQIGTIENLIKNEDISVEKRKQLENDLSKYKLEIAQLDLDNQQYYLDKKIELEKQANEKIKDMQNELAYALIDITNSIFDRRIQNIDNEMDKLGEYYDRQIELAGEDEALKTRLENEREKKEKKLEEKRKKELVKQAIFNRTIAIAEIGIDLAKTIMSINAAAAAMDAITPYAFGAVGLAYRGLQIPLAIGVAAAQSASVLLAPIPQYEKGTDNHKGGFARVGEKRPEVILEPGKAPYLVNHDMIVDLPKGTQVIPSIDKYEKILRASMMTSLANEKGKMDAYQLNMTMDSYYNAQVVDELKQLRKQKQNVIVNNKINVDLEHQFWRMRNLNW